MLLTQTPVTKYAVALFPGFQALDVFGPLDVLNFLSRTVPLELSVIGPTLEPVSTLHNGPSTRIGQSVVPTHTYDNAPDDIEVLLVPGGMGTRDLDNTDRVKEFVRERYPKLKYLLTVCTGSAIAAQAGVLDGKEATSNKRSFSWVSESSRVNASVLTGARSHLRDLTSSGSRRLGGLRMEIFGPLLAFQRVLT